jgi:hypothetical protein
MDYDQHTDPSDIARIESRVILRIHKVSQNLESKEIRIINPHFIRVDHLISN